MSAEHDKTDHLQLFEGKPTEHISKLMEILTPLATFKTYKQYRNIQLSNKNIPLCILLLKGSASVCRQKDSLVLTNTYAPAIMGLASLGMNQSEFFLRTETDVELGLLPAKQALECIQQHNLLISLMYLQAYFIQSLGEREVNIPGTSIYESICRHLLQLMDEPEEIRLSTSAYTYIQERTNFSRSRIMNILSALRQGEYIKIENGKLQYVGKLPDKF
ncbi:helix-turn-helix domain-containing protein [Jinshanibacter sp. LJY008]|uniref:Helix-turn-helix domain-containing protein n=1 Tax=Limnobaculum eriocheiris TaxID=2897391 RepID=A0A9X1MU48_9GAMM|nr:winged helix-turn-helix transcriptional regulator [Limnobaculum eriocheiris]MCD1124974.1 helix-turn-helix domain-containing protein [Limnobaculum eriocheiris]